MKKIIALVLSAVIITAFASVSLTGCANQADSVNNSEEIDITTLPTKFDLRNADGKNYVTPVKNQRWGDCWTFALAGSAENAYLYANDLGVPAGEKNENVNFSEKYIAWYMFHGITKDDVETGKVRASQIGEGFDPSEAEKSNDLTPYFIGGPFVQTANLFGSGFGPVDENVSINDEYPFAYNDEASVGWQLPLNSEYRNAPVTALFKNSNILPPPASIDKEGNYSFNREGIDAIKAELYLGHGVSIALNASNGGINHKKRTAYFSGDDGPDHAVVVVGYDDNYPKESFTRKKSSGEVIEGSTPPENGALIIKNSWGQQSFDGDIDDGYFYLSYYDRSLLAAQSFEFENNQNAPHTERRYDQYDLMMTQWYGVSEYESETKTANIFEAEDDGSLYQIEYRTAFSEAEVTYEIYRDADNGNPASGTLLETGVNSHKYSGSHVVNLKGEYRLKKGDRYSVVLTIKRGDAYAEVFPYNTKFFEGMTATGIINQGESFLYSDGKWTDMTEMKDSLIERAFLQCSEETGSDKALPEIELDKANFTVDNYPIKAILAPEGK